MAEIAKILYFENCEEMKLVGITGTKGKTTTAEFIGRCISSLGKTLLVISTLGVSWYGLDMEKHPNWFDASYISWLSYDSLNIELPDGFLYFLPIINWGKYRVENGRLLMPVSVRMNHAIADGYLIANVFRLLEKEMVAFCNGKRQ